ncbi:MAG TPA: MFS transporter [Burkholderiaceae bacterium]|nr:MFS transporter [Burkholderiaceae bacterium]
MSQPTPSRLHRFFESSPLRHPSFRHYYIGGLGVSLGYTMQATMAAWLMATLTPSALMVALVQTASTAPALLFGLIAGALADLVDRRKVILVTQSVLLAGTALLGVTTLAGMIGPGSLLFLTFVIGSGFMLAIPAQQASINELVSRPDLPRAVALGAVSFNMARAVGPALAGAIAALLTSGSAFLASALCFLPLILVVRSWKPRKPGLPGVPETLLSGVQSGLRFARHSPAMRALVIRNVTFCLCGSSFWALLPVIARDQLALGAGGFGLLSGSFGAGAVAGALWIPRRLKTVSLNSVVTGGVLLWIVATLVVAASHITAIAVIGAVGVGVAWVSVLASLSAGTQSTAPDWVRARAVSATLVAVQASLALGSAVWGAVASAGGTQLALVIAAAAMLVLHMFNRRYPVGMGTEAEVTTGVQLPDIAMAIEPMPNDGPVLIQLEYRIDPDNEAAFIRAIHDVEPTRRRNGATSWRVFRDVGEAGRFVERYVIASWAEYVRLRMRMTFADREIQERVAQLQREGVPVRVSRLIGVNPTDGLPADGEPAES